MSRLLVIAAASAFLVATGCSVQPFQPETETAARSGRAASEPPELKSIEEPLVSAPGEAPRIEAPPPTQLPRERPKAKPASLSPASQALVNQARTQRRKGDLAGATVALERALRIEPSNPLLWIEMGWLRMDQQNYAQAENMGRKALSMSVGDDSTQSSAWRLVGESLKARGKNPQAQEAFERSRELTAQ